MTKTLLSLLLLSASLASDANQAGLYPPWLETTSCPFEQPLPTTIPETLVSIKYYPPEAYNRNLCKSIKPVVSVSQAEQSADLLLKRELQLNYLTWQYNVFSWAAFIAVNRAVDKEFVITDENLKSAQTPVWLNWRTTESVFLEDGSAPKEWLFTENKQYNPAVSNIHQVVDHQFNAATDGVLIDQQDNPVYYQKYMNPVAFNFIKTNELYNLDGQITYANSHGEVSFAQGSFLLCNGKSNATGAPSIPCTPATNMRDIDSNDPSGPVELKIAWKVLTDADDVSRYIHVNTDVLITDDNVSKVVQKKLGVVGFHLAQKTTSSPKWVFSTFTHLDNVLTEPSSEQSPSFFDRQCPECAVNVANGGSSKTQVKLMDPINSITQTINQQVQAKLAVEGSVLQFYQLVGTQFTTDFSAAEQIQLPGKIVNYSGYGPYPVFLTNEVIETFLQLGNVKTDNRTYYQSSSCMNCHAKGAIATSYKQQGTQKKVIWGHNNGDMSFNFYDAHWKKEGH